MGTATTTPPPAVAEAPRRRKRASKTLAGQRLSVGVLVDLFWEPAAGGHVKCWERFAEAAATRNDLDLTVYFLGERKSVVPVGENVRYATIRPFVPTHWFRFLDQMPDHTDLAALHPGLVRLLRRHHVLHTTSAFFSLARTALYFSRLAGRPLVNSIHTDTPGYTRVYSAQVIPRLLGDGWLGRRLRGWHLHERLGAMMERRLAGYLRRCDWVLGSDAEDMANVKKILPQGRFSVLRRGIDKDTFHTGKHDRQKLHDAFDIPEDRFVLLCVGRLDPDKSVLTLARAARALLDQGAPVHVIFAGDGTQKDELRRMLGDRASLPGSLPQADLGWLYASADLFVFPSPHEISPNVVLEAKASGLPVVVSAEGGSAQFVEKSGEDGLVLDTQNPAAWAEAIEFLRLHPERRAAMGENGLRWIETHWPSWQSVLEEDLLPVWQRVARERSLWQPAL